MRALIIVVLLVLGAGAAFWFYQQSQSADPPQAAIEPSVSPTLPLDLGQAEPEPESAPPESSPEVAGDSAEEMALDEEPAPEPLPPLTRSDAEASAVAASLIGEDAVLRYVVSEAMIARTVATIDSLGSRQVPANVMAIQPPPTEFTAEPDEWPDRLILDEAGDPVDQFTSSEANHARYTPYVELLEAMDTQEAMDAYAQYQPLFQEAFAQLGYGAVRFEDRLVSVIDELLATPEVDEPVQLKKPEAFYLYVDGDLEALTAGQKILIRMGPENASRVKAKLREFRQVLSQEP